MLLHASFWPPPDSRWRPAQFLAYFISTVSFFRALLSSVTPSDSSSRVVHRWLTKAEPSRKAWSRSGTFD